MRLFNLSFATLCVTALMLAGCATSPNTDAKKEELRNEAQSAVKGMKATEPGLDGLLKNAHAYAIFPSVGKGGVIVGGAYGRGEVYEKGTFIGYTDLSQANIGLQLGGQTFRELILFENAMALEKFKTGKVKFAADASAVALKSGAAATAKFTEGVMVFTEPNGGLMFEASIGGQQFTFEAK